ncbi:sensor domain-containing diguanylate cyclase [Luteimonas aquatica]|uniref:sensor domain-containing diguanylate cyclase n=1 Tax=Luteimonas aquatica TaxID=450364 RepID=UPI001F5A3C2A|nr:diguanylate cyclase [Luteimonas aquatica]
MTYQQGLERLVDAVQELSLARDLDAVTDVVRRTARALTGADGATFVLRDGDKCYYADEDAIEPLWKGQRFPLSICISGWAMLNRSATVIEDIYLDPRVPHEAYRPTFVKSLVMVPIRTRDPIGAIGNYWAQPHRATEQEVHLLRALADSASVAMENVQVYSELERRVEERTHQLHAEISERRRAQEAVQRLSQTDELTGLLNRRGFFEHGERAFAALRARGEPCCLIYIDLDGLKRANDAAGHAAGDALIRAAAGLLGRAFREDDLLARIGGDEFVVLAAGEAPDVEALRARMSAPAHGAAPQFSIGTACAAGGGQTTLDQMIAEADRSMYADKCRRRGDAGAR